MITPDLEDLNQKFSIQSAAQELTFHNGPGDIPVINIQNKLASARISLQGAHVLSWQPLGENEVIWVSEEASFAPGKSVRGGVPVCWPWFGAHETNASYPAHGFARTVFWPVTSTEALPNGETKIVFQLDTRNLDGNQQSMWPLDTIAEYQITVGDTLAMELTTRNMSKQTFSIGQALHTYFSIHDIADTRVFGLEGKDYLDKTSGFKRITQNGPITISEEVDRIYLQTPDDVVIEDGKRKLRISKQGSHSTVVWNPWQAVAEKMGDLGTEGYRKMLCVESANAAADTVTLNPGDSHCLRVRYAIEQS